MSTLTDFDSITNQSLSGMNLPDQCFADAGLFSNPSLQCSSYGSGAYSNLFEDPSFLIEDKYCTVPSLYSPPLDNSDNNISSRTEQVPSTSSAYEEVQDDDEGDGLLSNLPNSCQDFENQELHIRLERNQSSPLVAGHTSPSHSSRMSSSCPSVEPPQEAADPEDLEVQYINESFEEQQKQSKMYQSGDLKTIFYSGSDQESSKGTSRSNTEKSGCSPLDRPERLPYVKKLLSQDSSHSLLSDSRPITPTQLLKPGQSFEPVLTPKSEALIQRQIAKKSSSNRRRVSEPLARKPPIYWNAESLSDLSSICDGPSSDVFELSDSSVVADHSGSTSARHVSFAKSDLVEPQHCTPPPHDFLDDTEKLAKGIVESLFEGVGLTPVEPTEDGFDPFSISERPKELKSARRLDMSEISTKELGVPSSSIEPPSPSKLPQPPACMPLEPADAGDSWEDLADDDELLAKQLAEAKLNTVTKAAPKKIINYHAPPKVKWDQMAMKNVLEAFNIPIYKMEKDVVQALDELGCGSTTVKWIERDIVLVAFDGEREAKQALVVQCHDWLRLRPLIYSSSEVQKAALECASALRTNIKKVRPATNIAVARRLVEGALGKKSTVSREQRQAENKVLRDARAAKKTAVKWDE